MTAPATTIPTTPRALPTAPDVTPRPPRDPFLDNARFWVMPLVVAGHALTYLIDDSPTARGLYTWIYTFHMPVFVLVSGYVSRRYEGSPSQVARLLRTVVVPYVLVCLALNVLEAALAGRTPSFNLLVPAWTMWFLAALVLWRVTSPVWRVVKCPVALAVAISLAGGLAVVEDVLGIQRVIGMLPFYVAGMFLRPEHFALLARPWFRVVSALGLVASLAVCMTQSRTWTISWLYWRDAYAEPPLDAGIVGGVLTRAGLLVLGFAMVAAVLSLVPRRRGLPSAMGTRTMSCYLLHGLILLLLAHLGLFDLVPAGTVGVLAIVVGAAALAVTLMSAPVHRWSTPVLTPGLSWLLRERGEPTARR